MYLSENLTAGKLDVTITPATVTEREGETMVERTDPLTCWLALRAGVDSISLRLTWEQLNSLHATLDALLHDHTRYVLGHNEPAEVLADRDTTAPVIDKLSHLATNVYTINGNRVVFTATDDWRLCVHTVNGSKAGVSDYPAWDSYGEALAYLESVLETRPANTRS